MAESSTVGSTEAAEQNTAPEPNVTNSAAPSTATAANNSGGKKTVDDYNFIKVLGEGSYATVIIFNYYRRDSWIRPRR